MNNQSLDQFGDEDLKPVSSMEIPKGEGILPSIMLVEWRAGELTISFRKESDRNLFRDVDIEVLAVDGVRCAGEAITFTKVFGETPPAALLTFGDSFKKDYPIELIVKNGEFAEKHSIIVR